MFHLHQVRRLYRHQKSRQLLQAVVQHPRTVGKIYDDGHVIIRTVIDRQLRPGRQPGLEVLVNIAPCDFLAHKTSSYPFWPLVHFLGLLLLYTLNFLSQLVKRKKWAKWAESPQTLANTGFLLATLGFQKWPNGRKKWPNARFHSFASPQNPMQKWPNARFFRPLPTFKTQKWPRNITWNYQK